jgi:SPP1 gp7 family putative phage head morphogenesis protein
MNHAHLSRIADGLADILAKRAGITHEAWFSVLFKALAPWERRYKAMLRGVWGEERKVVLANLKKLKGYASKGDSLIDSILYPKRKFIELLTSETKTILVGLIETEGTRVLDMLDLDMAFNVTNPNVTRWLEDYVPKFSEALEKVNTDLLKTTLTEGMDAGETIPELMARVNETFDQFDRYRAEMIARSETSRAANEAALESYRQSGVVMRKVWMTAPDCCDICAEMDGKVVGIDEAFFDDDYGDGEGPPAHPNCRCSVAADID